MPVTLLVEPDLTPSAKVLWQALRLAPTAGPAELEARTGLSRHTVQSGLAQLGALPAEARGEAQVKVPAALLADRRVGTQAKLLYGLLQVTPHFRGDGGQFTYAALSAATHAGPGTLRRAMGELAGAG